MGAVTVSQRPPEQKSSADRSHEAGRQSYNHNHDATVFTTVPKLSPSLSSLSSAHRSKAYVDEWLIRNGSSGSIPSTRSTSPRTVIQFDDPAININDDTDNAQSDSLSRRTPSIISGSLPESSEAVSSDFLLTALRPLRPRSQSRSREKVVSPGVSSRTARPRSPSLERLSPITLTDDEALVRESNGYPDSAQRDVGIDNTSVSPDRPQRPRSPSPERNASPERGSLHALPSTRRKAFDQNATNEQTTSPSRSSAGWSHEETDQQSESDRTSESPASHKVSLSPPPLAPMPPPPRVSAPPQEMIPTVFNIARSLAGGRSLKRDGMPMRSGMSRYRSSYSNTTKGNSPRTSYRDSSTQTSDITDIPTGPRTSGQSLVSAASIASKGTQTSTRSSQPLSMRSSESSIPAHQPKDPVDSRNCAKEDSGKDDSRLSLPVRRPDILPKKVPPNAKSTRISRILVNVEALTFMNIPHEAGDEHIAVHRLLTREEIMELAELTEDIREARTKGIEARERMWQQWRSGRYKI